MKIERYEAYKNSEIEWLEEIPEHWLSVRIKDVIKHIDQGWSPNAENRTVEEGEWGVLKLSAISNGKYYEINHKPCLIQQTLSINILLKKAIF